MPGKRSLLGAIDADNFGCTRAAKEVDDYAGGVAAGLNLGRFETGGEEQVAAILLGALEEIPIHQPLVFGLVIQQAIFKGNVDDAAIGQRLAPPGQKRDQIFIGNVIAKSDAIDDVAQAEAADV